MAQAEPGHENRRQSLPRAAMKEWFWVGKYLIVIVAALLLGAVLGSLDPFRNATIGSAHVAAGALVQFVAQSGALAMLWALGVRHSGQLRLGRGRAAHLSSSVLALVSLIVVASFYGVLLHFITPFLTQDLKPYIDWGFISAILGTSAWLLWSLFTHSEAFLLANDKPGATDKRARGAA